MSDEEDYMSDKFLVQSEDVRPGLLSREAQRLHKQKQQHKELIQQSKRTGRKVVEEQNRTQGLGKALNSENVGFRMMQKMGYQPGSSIGLRAGGRTEPVGIELKVDRGGLGQQTEKKRKQEVMEKVNAIYKQRRMASESKLKVKFRENTRKRRDEEEARRDLVISQKACEQLDARNDVTEPFHAFFWPEEFVASKNQPEALQEGSEESETIVEEDLTPLSDKLEMLTLYLRTKYYYCIWCGTSYDNKDDMLSNCPGSTNAGHNS